MSHHIQHVKVVTGTVFNADGSVKIMFTGGGMKSKVGAKIKSKVQFIGV